jgi:hypothetical protein
MSRPKESNDGVTMSATDNTMSGLFTVALEIATKRANTLGEMRKAFETDDQERALQLAKQLCGLPVQEAIH